MPTTYPKASYSEVTGLLVLLHGHGDSDDVARLADDLDLEIDEILPSLEFAEALGLVAVADGRATITPVGSSVVGASIRARKTLLREQLKKTTLFKTLVGALESAPERKLSEEELVRIIDFTPAPADALVQNIINWGRHTELFRYDAEQRVLLPWRSRPSKGGAPAGGSPPPGEAAPVPREPIPDVAPENATGSKETLLPLGV